MTNLTDVDRETYAEHTAELAQAWKELDDERNKINKLDVEIAKLKDDNGKLELTNQNIIKSFQDLYNSYTQLYDQVTNSNAALTITAGKLAESLVKCKFTIPQAENQQL
jgi:predicted nuclease with TOPRIM domain